jgi:lipoprotein Spr
MNFLKKYGWLISIVLLIACAAKKKTSTLSNRKNIEEKYARLLSTPKDRIANTKLYAAIDDWYGVKYQLGGKSKEGVDCSNLTAILYREAYNQAISGTAADLYRQSIKVKKDSLEEGDLVFFCTHSTTVSHVGIYLQNNKFVHASSKAGVMISDLNEEYFVRYYKGSGRLKN